jgi:hypothetical protein
MAEPKTNLEMIKLCMQRANALELTLRSIIDNTEFSNKFHKIYFHAELRDKASRMIAFLSWLEEANTKA